MSSRFVSAGQIDADTGDAVSPPRASQPPSSSSTTTNSTTTSSADASRKQAEWAAVQAQLDAERQRRDEAQRASSDAAVGPNGERSLYDVLQANKAAKQAAFEEANRIRNQFRALDDDEIEFLDGVRETRRREEERRRAEVEEGLRAFREAQAKEGKAAVGAEGGDEGSRDEAAREQPGDEWAVTGRKRKREKEKVIKGIKRRTSSAGKDLEKTTAEKTVAERGEDDAQTKGPETKTTQPATQKSVPTGPPTTTKPKPKAGLVDYGSDDDSD